SHAGWRKILKALGRLLNRPLVDLANARNGSFKAKLQFVRAHPKDPCTPILIAELESAKKEELDRAVEEATQIIHEGLAKANECLDLHQTEFKKRYERIAFGEDPGTIELPTAIRRVFAGVNGESIRRTLEARSNEAEAALLQSNKLVDELREKYATSQL